MAAQPDPARYVSLIEGGGADSLRDDVQWAYVEPARGHFSWSTPDKIVAQAARHRLHPLLIVDTSPPWASGGKTTKPDLVLAAAPQPCRLRRDRRQGRGPLSEARIWKRLSWAGGFY